MMMLLPSYAAIYYDDIYAASCQAEFTMMPPMLTSDIFFAPPQDAETGRYCCR